MNKKASSFAIASTCAVLAIIAAIVCPAPLQAQSNMPEYEVDPFWPKPLPNRWVIGQVGGVCVDAQDHVWRQVSAARGCMASRPFVWDRR